MGGSSSSGEGAERFLEAFALDPKGMVMTANLAVALRTRRLPPTVCARWLSRCAEEYGDYPIEATRAMEVFGRVMEAWHAEFFFHAPVQFAPDTYVALVLCASVFFPLSYPKAQQEGTHFIAAEFFQARGSDPPALYRERSSGPQDSGWNDDDLARLALDLEEAMDLYPNRPLVLGGGFRAVFVTSADAPDWRERRRRAMTERCGDAIRDYLGVDWKKDEVLVEIRPRHTLDSLIDTGRRVAAPTAFEAWRHDFFRQHGPGTVPHDWGLTVDFALLRDASAADSPVDGALEAILDQLSLEPISNTIEITPVGPVRKANQVTVNDHLRHLLNGSTMEEARRTVLGTP